MKKFLHILIAVLISQPALARDFNFEYEGQTLTYTVIDEEAKTCKTKDGFCLEEDRYGGYYYECGNEVSGNLVIPPKVNDGETVYTVTSIGYCAFIGCRKLTSVTIPETVTSIGYRAFVDCEKLPSITIPPSVTVIEREAFKKCDGLNKAEFADIETICKTRFDDITANPLFYAENLYINETRVTDVIIPQSITDIGDFAFTGCNMTSLSIPNSVTSIGDGAFSYCSNLSSIEIPESVTSIGDGAFQGCQGITSITIPPSVSSTGNRVFNWCRYLKSVTISEGVTSIGYKAFAMCNSLSSVVIPESVTEINDEAFYNCSNLHSIDLPGSLTSIGKAAFAQCYLSTIYIPENVTSIGKSAFAACPILKSVTIPSGISSIGDCAFNCHDLKTIYYGADIPVQCEYKTFDDCVYERATLYMSEKGASSVASTNYWNLFKNIEVHDFSGVDDILTDFDETASCEIYTLNGAKVCGSPDTLAPGLYVVRKGNKSERIMVK